MFSPRSADTSPKSGLVVGIRDLCSVWAHSAAFRFSDQSKVGSLRHIYTALQALKAHMYDWQKDRAVSLHRDRLKKLGRARNIAF